MFCPKCGQTNPNEAKFCGKCGAAMALADTAPAGTAAGKTPGGATTINPTLKNGILVGSVFIPLLGIIMGAIYLLDANPEKKAVGRLWLIVGGVAALVWLVLMN
jgi:uncharacterized membrane protein YvbJ